MKQTISDEAVEQVWSVLKNNNGHNFYISREKLMTETGYSDRTNRVAINILRKRGRLIWSVSNDDAADDDKKVRGYFVSYNADDDKYGEHFIAETKSRIADLWEIIEASQNYFKNKSQGVLL